MDLEFLLDMSKVLRLTNSCKACVLVYKKCVRGIVKDSYCTCKGIIEDLIKDCI